jgi:hypothetical protein
MKFMKIVAASLLAMTTIPAAAQEAPEVTLSVGTTVYGNDDAPIGTITQTIDGVVVLDTGAHQIPLPGEAFYTSEAGTAVNDTRDSLNARMDALKAEQEAALSAALVEGATLHSSDGVAVGTIQAVNDDGSVLIAQDERAFTLERAQLGTDPAGGPMMLFTAAQLQAAFGG